MAGIDLVLTGLMLICLDGQTDCPRNASAMNTAWIAKAKTGDTLCGIKNTTSSSRLEIRFRNGELVVKYEDWSCKDEYDANGRPTGYQTCDLPEDRPICISTDEAHPIPTNFFSDSSFGTLPRLEEVDLRFKRLDPGERQAYAPVAVNFSFGSITAGPVWQRQGNPVTWYRSGKSDSGTLPSYLSDRLQSHYAATKIVARYCDAKSSEYLEFKSNFPELDRVLMLRNRTNVVIEPPLGEDLYLLTYTLYYYRLGLWGSGLNKCPKYNDRDAPAVLLGCKGERCYCSDDLCNADSTYWPPFVHPDH